MTTTQISIYTLAFLVFLALAFDFMNGFHDAANSIATVVSTRVLKPHHAVLFAAFFNIAAIMVFDLKVAAAIGKGIVDPKFILEHCDMDFRYSFELFSRFGRRHDWRDCCKSGCWGIDFSRYFQNRFVYRAFTDDWFYFGRPDDAARWLVV
jgi:hypothetical protein